MKKRSLSTKPNFIINETINVVFFCFVYVLPYRKSDRGKLDLIRQYIFNYAEICPNEASFRREMTNHLVINFSMRWKDIGENTFVYIRFTLPKEGVIEGYSLEKSLSFIASVLKQPYLEKGLFEKKRFEREKAYILDQVREKKPRIYSYSFKRVMHLLDPKETLFVSNETIYKKVEKLTPEICTAYFQNLFARPYIPYVYGNFKKENVEKWLYDYFPQNHLSVSFNADYFQMFPFSETRIIEEQGTFHQTALYMVYEVKEYKKSERMHLLLLTDLLGSEEIALIFNTLRIQHHLVYGSHVLVKSYNGLFMIETYLNHENKDKAIKLIEDCFIKLQDEEFLASVMEKIRKGMQVDLLREKDEHYSVIDDKSFRDFNQPTLEEECEAYTNITPKEMVSFIKRVHLKLTYVLKEDHHD